MVRILLLVFLLAPAQEPARIRLEHQGTLSEAAESLSAATGATIKVLDGVDPKAFGVKVESAGFFEALDAVCRAHGGVSYIQGSVAPYEGQVELKPVPWKEYPSSYWQDFKVVVTEVAGFTSAVSSGPERWNRVYFSLLGPPWLAVRERTRAASWWDIDEALDADGNDVRGSDNSEPGQRVDLVFHGSLTKGNLISRVCRFKPFDVDKGLKSLKGSVQLTAEIPKEVEVPLAAGKTAETPAGTVTVDSVQEFEPQAWRITLTLKPGDKIRTLGQAFDSRHRYTGKGFDNRVYIATLPREGWTFSYVLRRQPAAPESIRLLARTGEQKIKVPFAFKDVRF